MTMWANKTPQEIVDDILLAISVMAQTPTERIIISRKAQDQMMRYYLTKRRYRRWHGKQKEGK